MAHISASFLNLTSVNSKVIPIWKSYSDTSDIVGHLFNKTLTGIVTVAGVNQANSPVFIYYRDTGKLIKRCLTDANGVYTVDFLDSADASKYFVVAITDHPNGYNAQIWDKLTPG